MAGGGDTGVARDAIQMRRSRLAQWATDMRAAKSRRLAELAVGSVFHGGEVEGVVGDFGAAKARLASHCTPTSLFYQSFTRAVVLWNTNNGSLDFVTIKHRQSVL